jgi:hypothetical protein
VVLLGQVDEMEVDTEGAYELQQAVSGLLLGPVQQRLLWLWVRQVART